MNKENFDNEKFERLLKEAASLAAKKAGESATPAKTSFSAEHEKKMQKLFKQVKLSEKMKKLRKYSLRAAAFALVLAIGAGTLTLSVDAWRVKFLNFVFDTDAPNTDYSFGDENTSYSDSFIALAYIPGGFVLADKQGGEGNYVLSFKSDENYFRLHLTALNSPTVIEKDNAEIKTIRIKEKRGNLDYKGEYISSEKFNALSWQSSKKSLCIIGDISKEEIIKIAKGIRE